MRVRRDDVTARSLVDDIRAFEPLCAQERVDRELMLERLACDPDAFERTSPAHVTCSAWVVDEAGEQTVLCYHKIYDSWSWVGGHADGCRDLVAVAARELEEETGIVGARLVPVGEGGILSLGVLPVAGHVRRGAWVSSHAHLNVTYLFVADACQPLRENPDENAGVRWVGLDEVIPLSTEPWMCEHVYEKLIARTRGLLGR